MTPTEISCKYCGCVEGQIYPGKGPHSYEIKCEGCNKHYKWASNLQVEKYTIDELKFLLFTEETLAISHAKGGDFSKFMAHSAKAEKIKDMIDERI